MQLEAFDHVSLPSRDLARSVAFYQAVLGFRPIARPAFGSDGAWLAAGALEIHLTVNPNGHFRRPELTPGDTHFAARVRDFAGMERHLRDKGYSETAPAGDPLRLLFRRNGPAPYQQVYLLDPDFHQIEINDGPAPTARA